MNVAINNHWQHESNSFAMDNDEYEKAFDDFISEDDEDKSIEYSQLYQPEQHQQPEDHQQLNEIFIEIPPPNLRLDLCPVCSRKFAPEALMKHVIICEKVNTKIRKPFDSSKQRTELTGAVVTGISPPVHVTRPQPRKSEPRESPPKTLHRKGSETSLKSQPYSSSERYNMLNNMSRKNSTLSLGGAPRIKKTVSHQSEKCPYCERVFGFKAYDRHVEWCKEKSLIKGSPDVASVSAAKERLKTRINYRAPNLKTKRGVTRDKYSNSCNGSTNSLADFDSHLNSMSSSMTSENGFYDPFLSAKKQLEELFSPTSTPSTQMINSMMVTPTSVNDGRKNNNLMTTSLTLNHVAISPKTPQPIPKMQSNFKRTSSLRISNRKPKPTVCTPSVKSNVYCGITDDGPISPCFVKAEDYDELPIKSPYSAIKLVERQNASQQKVLPSQLVPVKDDKPMLRNNMSLVRKNLKLDLRNKNNPNFGLSKTDSLALFLKYENELTVKLSEKELKDQSNSLSKKTINAPTNSFATRDNKLPDINSTSAMQPQIQPQTVNEDTKNDERTLVSIDNLYRNQVASNKSKSHSAPVKSTNSSENLPALTSVVDSTDKSRSPSMDHKSTDEDSPQSTRRSGSNTLRRKKKYNMNNILFDTDPEPTVSLRSSSDNSSLIVPELRAPIPTALDEFDFDQFIASFQDDDQFPIFKDYKMILNSDNNNIKKHDLTSLPSTKSVDMNVSGTKPIHIHSQQQLQKEKLSDLCKMLGGNSDSDESHHFERERSDSQRSDSQTRSKSSADSAYGSLSNQPQSTFDPRKISTFKPAPMPVRQPLELKKSDIVLSPIEMPNYHHEIPKDATAPLNAINDRLSKFCHECGYKFVVPTAKFCIECGVRRVKMEN